MYKPTERPLRPYLKAAAVHGTEKVGVINQLGKQADGSKGHRTGKLAGVRRIRMVFTPVNTFIKDFYYEREYC